MYSQKNNHLQRRARVDPDNYKIYNYVSLQTILIRL